MNVELPSGEILEDVPDGTTRAQLVEKLRANGYDVTGLAPAPAPAPPPTLGQRVGQGAADLAAGLGKVGAIALSPYDLAADVVQGRNLGTGNRERRGAIDAFAGEHGANNWTSVVNQAAPEVAATLGPAGRAASLASRPLLADVAASGAYEGTKSLLQGENPLAGTLLGAGGAAAGGAVARSARALPRALSRPTLTPEARRLMDAGIPITPGQAFGGRTARAEELAKNIPGLGAPIERAQRRAGTRYFGAEIDDAMSPLGAKIEGDGLKAVARANEVIDASYKSVVPLTHWKPQDLDNALQVSRGTNFPLLDDAKRVQFDKYINTKYQPLVASGQTIDGRTARDLDIELGKDIRRLDNVEPAMADALRELQKNLRGALDSADPQVLAQLAATNAAFAGMVPLAKAANRAGRTGGTPTPEQLRRELARGRGALNLSGGDLSDAAMEAIGPTASARLPRALALTGAGVGSLPVAAAVYGVGAGLGRALYSERGTKAVINALNLKPSVRDWLSTQPIERQREFLRRYAKEVPEVGQLAAQVGRQIAVQEGEQ